MNTKKSIVVALVCAVAPLASQAADSPSATLNECVKAFSATYLPGRHVRSTKLSYSNPSATLDYWKPQQYTLELTARSAGSRDVLAEARCFVDHGEIVVVLNPGSEGIVTVEEEAK